MNILQQQYVFLQFNKFSIHREGCIGWLKYTSTTLTLQSSTKIRVKNMNKIVYLIQTEINTPTTTDYKTITGIPLERSRNCISTINLSDDDEWK